MFVLGPECNEGDETGQEIDVPLSTTDNRFSTQARSLCSLVQVGWLLAILFAVSSFGAGCNSDVVDESRGACGKGGCADASPPSDGWSLVAETDVGVVDTTCRPRPSAQICTRAARECGTFKGEDGCGAEVEVDCGSCPGNKKCGVESPNVCGCACRIDGACFQEGEFAPDNPCRRCDPDESTTRWSTAPHCFIQVAAGGTHTCGIDARDRLHCWGGNGDGQAEPPKGSFTAVASGWKHNCAIDSSGGLHCWGSDDAGQSSPPSGEFGTVSVGRDHSCAIDQSKNLHCWGADGSAAPMAPSGKFVDVSAGVEHSCAIDESDRLHCWGDDSEGEASPPTGSFVDVTVGPSHSCAIDASKQLRCWGSGATGEASPPSGSFVEVRSNGFSQSSRYYRGKERATCAVDVSGDVHCWGDERDGWYAAPAGEFHGLTAGGAHVCALDSSNRLHCWGPDFAGAATLPSGPFKEVSAGAYHVCGIDSDRQLHCWGRHAPIRSAQHSMRAFEPTQPEGAYLDVSAGYGHVCAVDTSNEIRCWDHNESVAHPNFAFDSLDREFRQVSAGATHTCGLAMSGEVFCEGRITVERGSGQWCRKDTQIYPSPKTGGFELISSGYFQTCGITTNGKVRCWGLEKSGGRWCAGADVTRSTPFASDAQSGSFISVSAGSDGHICAIDSTSEVHGCESLSGNRNIKDLDVGRAICSVDSSNQLECVGELVLSPSESFSEVSVGTTYTWQRLRDNNFGPVAPSACGLSTSGRIHCWGNYDLITY